MLARWYLLLGQCSVTFEYHPGAQHANADGMSRQCGQCQRPDCPASAQDSPTLENNEEIEMVDQPFAASEIGELIDADLLPELSGETLVASALTEEFMADLPSGSNIDLNAESRNDNMLAVVLGWIQSNSTLTWTDCVGLSPELRCWRLQIGNVSIDTDGRLWRRRAQPAEGSQLEVPRKERHAKIRRFHDSLFAGHSGISRTWIADISWPGLRNDVRTYIASCTVCIARKSTCPRRAPMGHVAVGRHWERVAMDLLDMSVTSAKGNRYVLVMVDCFSRWTEACPLSDKTSISVADAFFSNIVCRFGMPSVIHSNQGREFENKVMHELCILGGAHKMKTTPYHPESDGHSTTPGRASDIYSLSGCKENTPIRWDAVMAYNTSDGRHSGGPNAGR